MKRVPMPLRARHLFVHYLACESSVPCRAVVVQIGCLIRSVCGCRFSHTVILMKTCSLYWFVSCVCMHRYLVLTMHTWTAEVAFFLFCQPEKSLSCTFNRPIFVKMYLGSWGSRTFLPYCWTKNSWWTILSQFQAMTLPQGSKVVYI